MAANPNWMYDFGDKTKTQLDALANPNITTAISNAKSAASTMIGSGAYGSAAASYRIIIRGDAALPTGYSVEIRLSP